MLWVDSLEAELELGAGVKYVIPLQEDLDCGSQTEPHITITPVAGLLKHNLLGSIPAVSDSESLQWGSRLAYRTRFPGEVHVIRGLGTRL